MSSLSASSTTSSSPWTRFYLQSVHTKRRCWQRALQIWTQRQHISDSLSDYIKWVRRKMCKQISIRKTNVYINIVCFTFHFISIFFYYLIQSNWYTVHTVGVWNFADSPCNVHQIRLAHLVVLNARYNSAMFIFFIPAKKLVTEKKK